MTIDYYEQSNSSNHSFHYNSENDNKTRVRTQKTVSRKRVIENFPQTVSLQSTPIP